MSELEELELEIRELGKRARACDSWRWLPGMLVDDDRIVHVHEDGTCTTSELVNVSYHYGSMDELWRGKLDQYQVPDLSDAATLGCLLALVREKWPDATTRLDRICGKKSGWVVNLNDDNQPTFAKHKYAATEAEALVLALDAAE